MLNPSKIFGRLGNSLFQYAQCYAYAKDNKIDFYFQDPKYFEKYKDEIKVLFGQGIYYIDQVAIHIRRGDYVNNPFYVDLMETSYYQNAMELFPGEKFLVFSDNIEWCKRQDIFKDCEFAENNTELEDLNLMAGCKGIIIANSSFSWWGAYLSKGKVVAPKEWYSDKKERTICPIEWERI